MLTMSICIAFHVVIHVVILKCTQTIVIVVCFALFSLSEVTVVSVIEAVVCASGISLSLVVIGNGVAPDTPSVLVCTSHVEHGSEYSMVMSSGSLLVGKFYT